MKLKVDSESVRLKFNIQKMTIMASGPITLCCINGQTIETVIDFIFLGIITTVGGDCNHEITMIVPWKERYDTLDSVLKIKDITSLIKVCLVKAMCFCLFVCFCFSILHVWI